MAFEGLPPTELKTTIPDRVPNPLASDTNGDRLSFGSNTPATTIADVVASTGSVENVSALAVPGNNKPATTAPTKKCLTNIRCDPHHNYASKLYRRAITC
jgi:hypothetical protein